MKHIFTGLVLVATALSLPACGGSSQGPANASSSSAKSYDAFHDSYKPHGKRPAPESVGVRLMQAMPADKSAGVFEAWIKDPSDKNKRVFAVNITSVSREKAGEIIDNMDPELAAEGINWLVDDMALDLMYYVSESTYERLAGNVRALQ